MDMEHGVYDVIVLGLGGMGSAAAAHLAERGLRVLGLEQHALGHERGASHGETRLIRKAYFESPRYVPLLERSYQLWDALGERSETTLLHRTGLALFARRGAGDDTTLARAKATAQELGIAIAELTAAEARARFPALAPSEELVCLFEPGAGFLEVDRCVATYAALARQLGAELRGGERVRAWSATPSHVTVTTDAGSYQAGRLVITAGPWSAQVLAELALPVRVHRVWQLWFAASEAMSSERGTPAFAFDLDGSFVYGFPRWGRWGCKICEHAPGEEVAPDAEPGTPSVPAAVQRIIATYLPAVDPALVAARPCLYAMTPDTHFLVDAHPRHANVCFAAGFSGHGFKFASAIGEALAELAIDGRASQDLSFLRLARFA